MQNRNTAFQVDHRQDPNMISDPRFLLQNLSMVRTRMDSLRQFLSESVDANTFVSKDQMNMVSNELVSAIQQIIQNGAVLVSYSQNLTATAASVRLPEPQDMVPSNKSELNSSGSDRGKQIVNLKVEVLEEEEVKDEGEDCEIVELYAVELLAEHVHFCEICGKGFRRDANLRMHMRAHGNQFKTPEALAKKPGSEKLEYTRRGATVRFSCPFEGCNRNKSHKKFRALKSIVCARNHFKRSHCPKMYSCNRCHKKNFSVLSDLKSHMKHCGESKWKCSCGTTFSRKDKLFGHIGLFEGHTPALPVDEEEKRRQAVTEGEEDEDSMVKEGVFGVNPLNCLDDGLPEGFFDDLEEFESIDKYIFQEALGFPNNVTYGGST